MLMNIRLAIPEDALQIAKVQVESWRSTYPGIVPKSYLDSLDVKKREKIWAQAAANQALYVAELNETIVGFAIGGENRDKDTYPEYDGELYAIYSYDRVHGQGIGKALFKSTVRNLAERGFKKMVVSVLSDNPAVEFYKRMGGKFIGEETIDIDNVKIQESFYGYEDIQNL